MSEFTCAICHETFEKIRDGSWSEKDAVEEFLDNFPEGKNDETASLCDYCYLAFKRWFSTISPEEKKRMRDEYINLQEKAKDVLQIG